MESFTLMYIGGNKMKIAMYPGSFDPLTNGHLDIITRASKLFDKVYVCVSVNPKKTYYFNVEEKISMCKMACKNLKNVETQEKKVFILYEIWYDKKDKIMEKLCNDEETTSRYNYRTFTGSVPGCLVYTGVR